MAATAAATAKGSRDITRGLKQNIWLAAIVLAGLGAQALQAQATPPPSRALVTNTQYGSGVQVMSGDGKYLYQISGWDARNGRGTGIAAYSVNATTGTLTFLANYPVASAATPARVWGLGIDQTLGLVFAWATTFSSSAATDTINAYTIGKEDGRLTQTGSVTPNIPNQAPMASQVLVSPATKAIYLWGYYMGDGCNDNIRVVSFQYSDTGAITQSAGPSLLQPNAAPGSAVLSGDGSRLFAVGVSQSCPGGSTGLIAMYPLAANGSLTGTGNQAVNEASITGNRYGLAVNAARNTLYILNTGSPTPIYVFGGGTLSQTQTKIPGNIVSLVFSADGSLAWGLLSDSSLQGFAVEPTTGALTPTGAALASAASTLGSGWAPELVASADKRFVSVTSDNATGTWVYRNTLRFKTTVSYTLSGLAAGKSVSVSMSDGTTGSTPSTAAANADGTVTFPNRLPVGSTYQLSVGTQPTNQLCTISNGSGTVTEEDIVATVTCANTYALGGTVTGLAAGQWLTVATAADSANKVDLANNPVNDATNAKSFTLPKRLVSGTAYTITVGNTPGKITYNPAKNSPTCSFTGANGATGTVGSTDITDIAITCTNSLGVYVFGLVAGQRITVQMNDNGAQRLITGITDNGYQWFSPNITTTTPYGYGFVSNGITSTGTPAATCLSANTEDPPGGVKMLTKRIQCSVTAVNLTIVGLSSGESMALALRSSFFANDVTATNVSSSTYNFSTATQPGGAGSARVPGNSSFTLVIDRLPRGQLCEIQNSSGVKVSTGTEKPTYTGDATEYTGVPLTIKCMANQP